MRLTEQALRRWWSSASSRSRLVSAGNDQLARNALIDLVRTGSADEALNVFRTSFRVSEGRPPVQFFEEFIGALGQAGRVEDAEGVFQSMKWFRVHSDPRVDAALLSAYVRNGRAETVRDLMASTQQPELMKRLTMMRFVDDGDMPVLRNFLEMIECPWNGKIFRTVAKELVQRKNLKLAEEVLHELVNMAGEEESHHAVYGFSVLLTEWAKQEDARSARKVFEGMKKCGVQPNAFCLTAMLTALSRAHQINTAIGMFEHYRREQTVPFDVVVYDRMLDIYASVGNVVKMEELLVEMTQRGFSPTAETFAAQIKGYGARSRLDRAEEVLESAVSCGKADDVTFSSMAGLYARRGEPEKIRWLMSWLREMSIRPTVFIWSNLIFAYGRNRDVVGAQRAFHEMESAGVAPNLITFTTLASLYVRVEDPESAQKMLDCVLRSGMKPDVEFTKTVVKAYALKGGIAAAVSALKRFFGGRPDNSTYQTLLRAYAQAGDVSGALKLVEGMWRRGERVGSFMVNSILRHSRNVVQLAQGLQLLGELGFKPSSGTIWALLAACGKIGDGRRAFELYLLLRKGREEVSPDAVASVLEALTKEKMPERCLWVLEDLNFDLTERGYQQAARCLGSCADTSSLERIIGLLNSRGQDPSTIEFFEVGLIDAYSRRGNRRAVSQAVACRAESGKQPVVEEVNALIRVGKLHGKPALIKIQDLGLVPTSETYELLLNGGMSAEDILQQIRLLFAEDSQAYTELITVYRKHGRVKGATQVLRMMDEKAVDLDASTLHAVLELQALVGDPPGVAHALKRIVSSGMSVDSHTESVIIDACAKFGTESVAKALAAETDGSLSKQTATVAVHAVAEALLNHGRLSEVENLCRVVKSADIDVNISSKGVSALKVL